MVLWPTNYNPFTFLSRNHQHFALTGYIALIACHRRFSILHRRRQSNTASSALFWINADCCTLPPFCSADTRKAPMARRSWKEISCHEAGTAGKMRMTPVWLCISISCIAVCIYVCPTSAHRGFRYGYRRYKRNTFTLETALFGSQCMILRSDLTLLNINISKNSTFA